MAEDILNKIIKDTTQRNQNKWRGFHVEKGIEDSRFVKGARVPLVPTILNTSYSKERESMYLIAEVKRASPSQGIICDSFDPLSIATTYKENGVDAISILTEERFFMGSVDHLLTIRQTMVDIPLLRKDFIVHPYQVKESYDFGADIVLLIVAALSDSMLQFLYEYITAYGMTALVEVHSENDLQRALNINPTLIGINNRDLRTFQVDINTSISLVKQIPSEVRVLSESGISSDVDVILLKSYGISGILVGQSILISDNPAEQINLLQLGKEYEYKN